MKPSPFPFPTLALALTLVLAACNNEPEPAMSAADEAALSADEEAPDEDAMSLPEAEEAEAVPQGETMQSGSNDGTERAPQTGSKLLPADPD